MRLVLVGPPGPGKGTQAQFIASHFAVPKISTGDIFRANVSEGHRPRLEAQVHGRRRPGPGRGHHRDGPGPAGRRPTPPRASCSTASRARPPGRGARRDAGRPALRWTSCSSWWSTTTRWCGGCPAGAPAAAAATSGTSTSTRRRPGRRPLRRRAVPARRRQRGHRPAPARGLRDQTAPLIDYYGDRGHPVGVDATGPVEDVTERAIDALRRSGD